MAALYSSIVFWHEGDLLSCVIFVTKSSAAKAIFFTIWCVSDKYIHIVIQWSIIHSSVTCLIINVDTQCNHWKCHLRSYEIYPCRFYLFHTNQIMNNHYLSLRIERHLVIVLCLCHLKDSSKHLRRHNRKRGWATVNIDCHFGIVDEWFWGGIKIWKYVVAII